MGYDPTSFAGPGHSAAPDRADDPPCSAALLTASSPYPAGALRASQYVRARIVWSSHEGLVLPVTAAIRINGQHFAFAVDSADAAYEDLLARGYKPVEPPVDLQSGYTAGQRYFDILDPDGVRIEFVERRNIAINQTTLHPEALSVG